MLTELSQSLARGQFPIADSPQTDECTMGVHFEDVTLMPTGRGLDGTVLTVEHLGAEKRVLVESGIGLIGVRADRAIAGEGW